VIFHLKWNGAGGGNWAHCGGDFLRRQWPRAHFAARAQKSRQGGRPVYSEIRSNCLPEGKRRPSSQELMVLIGTPRSAATCFNGRRRCRRHVLNAAAKLFRISHRSPEVPATEKFQHKREGEGSEKITNTGARTLAGQLEKLHPDNRHARDKIRQQLQAGFLFARICVCRLTQMPDANRLRDAKLLIQVSSGLWRLP